MNGHKIQILLKLPDRDLTWRVASCGVVTFKVQWAVPQTTAVVHGCTCDPPSHDPVVVMKWVKMSRCFCKKLTKNSVPSRVLRYQALGWGFRANLIFSHLNMFKMSKKDLTFYDKFLTSQLKFSSHSLYKHPHKRC